jgi:Leucine-rich repeat (LRR) protein
MTRVRAGVLALLLSGAALPATTAQAQSNLEILDDLYDATGGYYWNDSRRWGSKNTYCTWSGVNCYDVNENDERYGQIEELDLSNNALQGELPQSVWSLPFLSRLILRGNPDLTVQFDESYKAQSLKQLVLSNTYIESFDKLVGEQLEQLHLTGCSLDMTFPYEITKLKNLKGLYANYNRFWGELPSQIGDMESLVELFLLNNNFEGEIPESIAMLEDLEILTLSKNKFTGELPGDQMNNLQELKVLALADNQFSGKIPGFAGLPNLEELYLQNNQFTGEIPQDFLYNAPKNEKVTVDLTNNKLSGVFQAQRIGQFSRLKLGLAGNEFTGIDNSLCANEYWMNGDVVEYECDAIMCPIGSWAPEGRSTDNFQCEEDCETSKFMGSTECDGDNMRILSDVYEALNGDKWIENNWFDPENDNECEWTGIVCEYDGNDKYIVKLDLSNMKLSGTVPSSLFTLEGLEYLDLSNNLISFKFAGIGNAASLYHLDITSTGLDSFDDIDQLVDTPITELLMSNNNVNGRIPESIYDLTGLTRLEVSNT